jgi:hypothetical protein
VTVIDKARRYTTSLSGGCDGGDRPDGTEEDFDALLASSSLGSEEALAIRAQAPASAREHARRVLDGKEKCPPVEGDIDDAIGELVNGLARRPSPRTVITSDSAVKDADLLINWGHLDQARAKIVIVNACRSAALPQAYRIRLLESLIEHDAFAELRTDVAWTIIDRTFDMMPSTPGVLRRCAFQVIGQVDVSSLPFTWLSSPGEPALLPRGIRLLAPSRREPGRRFLIRCRMPTAAARAKALGAAGSGGPAAAGRASDTTSCRRASRAVLVRSVSAVAATAITAAGVVKAELEQTVLGVLATAAMALAGIALTIGLLADPAIGGILCSLSHRKKTGITRPRHKEITGQAAEDNSAGIAARTASGMNPGGDSRQRADGPRDEESLRRGNARAPQRKPIATAWRFR